MINRKNVESNLKEYRRTLTLVKANDLSELDDAGVKALSRSLMERAKSGEPERNLLPLTFACVFEAAKRTLGVTPHDVQLLAAAAMANGRIVELPTGEGKTLAAVFVACLGALSGRGVHVLTFNDYLAWRDALWMTPVYNFLGLTVRFIRESMTEKERKAAYGADITYLTAKEAGFDYLRGFLAFDLHSIVQRPFHLAIIDEADSILIDEARIPLVIAGDLPARVDINQKILFAVRELKKDIHYTMDEYANNISLTESGADFLERRLDVPNLYDKNFLELLTKINLTMQAQFLLQRDVDYIVRGRKVLLVDEFTGRIAKNREWPDGLQAAVENKEGLLPKIHGIVMNRITLQNFLQFYPNLCGMTGTACSAAPELDEFYGKAVTVIPPDRPCIRIDRPDEVFTNKAAKMQAISGEIIKVHKSGRPILVGTATIEESERLASMLRPKIPNIAVLNAKNDAQEAAVIANAGRLSAVTISTNMAGRGVDIRLGGGYRAEYEKVCALGGLYVIGANRYESVRIDNQLRGRAGRQGDPGESRFFVSLEDDLMVKYRLGDALPKKYRNLSQNTPLGNPAVNKAIFHTQRVAEGQSLDAKITLSKYSSVAEDQRKIVYEKRMNILTGVTEPSILEQADPERHHALLERISQDELTRAQRAVELFSINRCWADHLQITESALDDVQVISAVRGDPLLHYNCRLVNAFDELETHIRETVLELFKKIVIVNGRVDLERMGVRGPSSTRTYMVNDGTEHFSLVDGIAASVVNAPLYGFYLIAAFFEKLRKKEKGSDLS